MEKREKKDDDESYFPLQGLEKGIVLQDKRIFNDTPLNPRKCCQLLTKVLYLLTQGEKFTKTEATDLFFACTKLFQSKDIPLRRMVYLVLKELIPIADNVIMVMASLTKDMNTKIDVYRANAIRVLCGITDTTLLGQVERYLKQAIVDKEPHVASSALVSGHHLMATSPEIVKRWVSEVQEAVSSKSAMVQYHALGLLHQIKQHDKLAVSKLVSSLTKTTIRSPYAHCLLIRLAVQVMEEDPNQGAGERTFFSYLEICLRHKSEMVIYEAARAICSLPNVTSRELTSAVTVLQLFLGSSSKPALRFSAVRTLNKLAQTHPLSVTTCNSDMENLITDPNRSIATLAITTLLKTGNESSIDRLMKQIGGFMSEISDEFKIVVVDAIRNLCIKFPQKHRSLLNFLSTILRDEGGFEFKKSVVETILSVIQDIPESKELGLTHLCEFIEDCEYTYLSVLILNLLGKEGPHTSSPNKYIRYIYNRISLENAAVRASAIVALGKFGLALESVRASIITLLQRIVVDNDDEVRDRALMTLSLLQQDPMLYSNLSNSEVTVPWKNMESVLLRYVKGAGEVAFDFTKVSHIPEKPSKPSSSSSSSSHSMGLAGKAEIGEPTPPVPAVSLANIPQFAHLGSVHHSSKVLDLTESETEYTVQCIKHTTANHIILQFNCVNTLKEVLLEHVHLKLGLSGVKGLSLETSIPLPSLPFGTPGATFVALKRQADLFPTGRIEACLKFVTKEVDVASGEAEESGTEDEYQLEEVEITVSDFMQKSFVPNFQEKWDQIGDEFEVVETYSLSTMKTLPDAVKGIIDHLGMQACDRSEVVPPKKTKHALYLSGNFLGGIPVLVRTRMKFVEGQGVQMELTVRSMSDDVSTLIAGSI